MVVYVTDERRRNGGKIRNNTEERNKKGETTIDGRK
jgi:hypothetical protein